MGVRWYDPNTGRYTTPDPTAQETNPYLYAGGNPCNATDPTGAASVAGFGCNAAVALLGVDFSVGWWAAGAIGAVQGGLRGAGVGAAIGFGIGVAGYFVCDGL